MARLGVLNFVISTQSALDTVQLRELAEMGLHPGIPFKLSEGGQVLTDDSLGRKQIKTLRNHGTVDAVSVSLETIWKPEKGIHYALKFSYTASEDMNAKVFFYAKDKEGKLSVRTNIKGATKWEDIVLPSGKNMKWDSSAHGRNGLYLEPSDPVFMRLRREACADNRKKYAAATADLYDIVIVLSFVNNSFDSIPQEADDGVEDPPIGVFVRPPTPVKDVDSGAPFNIDSGDIELKSGRVGEMKKLLGNRWNEAKQAMLQGLSSPISQRTRASSFSKSGANINADVDSFVSCEKTRCRLLALPNEDWTPPPSDKSIYHDETGGIDTRGIAPSAGAGAPRGGFAATPRDGFKDLRHRYGGVRRQTTYQMKADLVRGPSMSVACIDQLYQYNNDDYVAKDVYGGTWADLCAESPGGGSKAAKTATDRAGGVEEFKTPGSDSSSGGRSTVVQGEDGSVTLRLGAGEGNTSAASADTDADADGGDTAGKSLFDDENYQDSYCVICMSAPRQVIVHPCNHCCVCSPCAAMLFNNADIHATSPEASTKCPMCRVPISVMLYLKDQASKDAPSSNSKSAVVMKPI
jgi:hypothetical protein